MADPRLMIVTHLLAAGAGYALAPREILESEISSAGWFTTDTKRVLSAAVESLRAENKLLVYSYRGSAAVSVERDGPLFLDARLDLTVGAQIGYHVDLSRLTLADVSYDERGKVLTVRLPPLEMGEIAFDVPNSVGRPGGLLSYNQGHVDQLSKQAFVRAKEAFTKQAQGSTLVATAERQARANVERHFGLALGAAGRPDLRVVATFEGA